jgi:hypothetical protein
MIARGSAALPALLDSGDARTGGKRRSKTETVSMILTLSAVVVAIELPPRAPLSRYGESVPESDDIYPESLHRWSGLLSSPPLGGGGYDFKPADKHTHHLPGAGRSVSGTMSSTNPGGTM